MKILKVARNKVYLESEAKEVIIDVSPEIIAKLDLKKDRELSVKEYREMISLASLSKSLFLLSRRDYGKKELFYKLKTKFNEPSILNETIAKLENRGFIDDLEFARGIINNSKDSKRKLEYSLSMKGIDRDIIREAFNESDHDEDKELLKQLKKVINKEKEKQYASLMRKGFKYNDIKRVMEEL